MVRNRVIVAAVVVVLIAVVVLLVVNRTGSRGQPYNVLLITLDTTRADRLGGYGYRLASTPALDELAAKGVLFEQAFCTAPLTLPSHATILTGLQPPEHRLRTNGQGRLSPAIPTLAEILRGQGYATGAFIAAFVLDSTFGLDRGFDTYDDDLSNAYEQEVSQPLMVYRGGNLVTDSALSWLERRAHKPFFCWVHLYDPHTPYYVHQELSETRFKDQESYDAEVAFVDMQVARLLAFLDEQDLLKRTLVIAVGDHGEGLYEHQESDHGWMLYETTLRVPLIFSLPGAIRQGHRARAMMSLVDLFPTILDFLGVPATEQVSGRSVKPALFAEPIEPVHCYSETDLPYAHFGWSPLRSLTTGRWKYIRTAHAELYDRRVDPRELANLIDARPETAQELETMLTAIEEQMVPRKVEQVELTAEAKYRLAAIGYVAVQREDVDTGSLDLSSLKDIKDMWPVLRLEFKYLALLGQGRTAEAVEVCRQMVRLDPDAPRIRLHLADALRKDDQPEQAMIELDQVLRLDPDDYVAHRRMGLTLLELGKVEDSIAHFTEALQLKPESARAHNDLAGALVRADRLDQAMQHLAKAMGVQVHHPGVHYNLANELIRHGKTDKAIEHYLEALRLQPGDAEAHSNLAVAFFRQGNVEKAIEHCRETLRLKPDHLNGHINLGIALMEQGRIDQAIQAYRAALRIDPDHEVANQALEEAMAKQRPSNTQPNPATMP